MKSRLLLGPGCKLRGVPSGAIVGGDIKIHKNFLKDGETFTQKVGKNCRECMLTKQFDYTSDAMLGILFTDRESSGTCSITFDDLVTVKNTYNTFVTFKGCKIQHTIEHPIKVYLLYL